jgi:hypothetical protein
MIETRLTPAHTNPLKSLLDKPFASTFNHAGAERKLLGLKALVVNMAMMTLEISLDLEKSGQGLTRKKVCVDQKGQVGEDFEMLSVAKLVAPTGKPSHGLEGRLFFKESLGSPPEMACSVKEIQNGDRAMGKASTIDTPEAPSTITEPNDLGCCFKGLASCFELKMRDEVINIAQYRHQPAIQQLWERLSRSVASGA